MMVVVDASALVDLLGGGPHAPRVDDRLRREPAVWAPHLVDAEVGHALRSAVRRGELGTERALIGLDSLAELDIERVPHRQLLRVAWSLRHNVSFHDGLYVALAAALDVPLLTLDARLAAAPGLPAAVECLAPA